MIISTGTKALQDQLYFRDIPFLETLRGRSARLLHEGASQLSLPPQITALRRQPILTGLEEIDQYRQIAEWEQTTETGDRAELSGCRSRARCGKSWMRGPKPAWVRPARIITAALLPRCGGVALESDIIIVNHHLFFADLSVKREAAGAPDAGILPEAAAVIFDEAHELEEVASSYFGLSVSNLRFEELARDTEMLLRGKEGAQNLPGLTQQLRDRARMFFAGVADGGDGRQPFTGREEFLESRAICTWRCAQPRSVLKPRWRLKGVDEAPGLKKRVARLRTDLEFLLESNASNMVYWMERRFDGAYRRPRQG